MNGRPVWADVRCPWCMQLLGHRIAGRTVSGIGLIRAHAEFCELREEGRARIR